MPNGTVKFFDVAKKYGFVSPDDGSKDVFVPIASLAAAGILALIAGQRVSFETLPDGKGPKAVDLKLVDIPARACATKTIAPKPKEGSGEHPLTFYYDASNEFATKSLVELRASGFEPKVVDYVATPPSVDELKMLALLLRDGSLVRRYDPLFHDLRLDDRFISQNEYWTGIVENPNLINGPILATKNAACICRSDDVAKHFLESFFPGPTLPAPEERRGAECAVVLAAEDDGAKTAAMNADALTPAVSDVEPAMRLR
jgi:cold shock protein